MVASSVTEDWTGLSPRGMSCQSQWHRLRGTVQRPREPGRCLPRPQTGPWEPRRWTLTSSPPLETPQTVCALTNLALMLKYLTFLQNKTRMLKCDLGPPTAQEWGGTAAVYPGLPRSPQTQGPQPPRGDALRPRAALVCGDRGGQASAELSPATWTCSPGREGPHMHPVLSPQHPLMSCCQGRGSAGRGRVARPREG